MCSGGVGSLRGLALNGVEEGDGRPLTPQRPLVVPAGQGEVELTTPTQGRLHRRGLGSRLSEHGQPATTILTQAFSYLAKNKLTDGKTPSQNSRFGQSRKKTLQKTCPKLL